MVKSYEGTVVANNSMEFIYNSFKPIFRFNNGWLRIWQEDFMKNIEWSAKIYHSIQKLIDRMQENFKQEKYVLIDGEQCFILVFQDKYEVRFVQIIIDNNYETDIQSNVILPNNKETYYKMLDFMSRKQIDNMLYDFCLA